MLAIHQSKTAQPKPENQRNGNEGAYQCVCDTLKTEFVPENEFKNNRLGRVILRGMYESKHSYYVCPRDLGDDVDKDIYYKLDVFDYSPSPDQPGPWGPCVFLLAMGIYGHTVTSLVQVFPSTEKEYLENTVE